MVMMDGGRVMDVREEHLQNAEIPIDVTDSGILMDVREEQPINACSLMVVMFGGMVTV